MQIALFCGKSLNFSQFLLLKRVAGANVSCWLSLSLSLPYFISYTFTFQRCTRSQIGARRQMMEKTELVKDKALKRNKKKDMEETETHTHTHIYIHRERVKKGRNAVVVADKNSISSPGISCVRKDLLEHCKNCKR